MKTIAHREQASSTVQVDNERVRVTEYTFESGAETTFHRHEWDYVVVPQTDGELLLVDGDGNETRASLASGVSYYRKAGVEHNVINAGAVSYTHLTLPTILPV